MRAFITKEGKFLTYPNDFSVDLKREEDQLEQEIDIEAISGFLKSECHISDRQLAESLAAYALPALISINVTNALEDIKNKGQTD